MLSRSTCLIACCVLAFAALAADEPRAEFTAKAGDYDAPFGEASAAIKQIILDEGFEVVGVADFTDLAGQPLQIGRLYAEEFATRLVGPRKKYRLLDPATLLGLVDASGGTSLWTTPEKIKQFGAKSKVELVVTGRIEIAAKEARFFIKAVATEDAGVVWAKTIAVPGVSAAAAEAAAKAEADAIAAQTKLVPQPIAADATQSDALAITVGGMFTGPDAATTTAPASSAGADSSAASPGPAVTAAAPTIGAIVAAPAPVSTPPATTATAASASAPVAVTAAAATAPAAHSPAATASKPVAAPSSAAAPASKPIASAPSPAASAPVGSGAVAATAAVTTAAAVVTAAAANPPPAPAPAPKPAPVQATPAPPPEVLTFENAWLRARVRSASKYEGSGWVTAVLDLTNLSDRPIKLDAAQDDPGKGVDELGNNWRIERVSGLKLASGAAAVNTTLNPSTTVSVVVVLATSASPSGRRLSFGPNIYWFGSSAAGDSGRVAVAFSNIRVN